MQSGRSLLRIPLVTDSKLECASVQWNWRAIVIGLAFLSFLLATKFVVRILNPFIFSPHCVHIPVYIKTIESGFTIKLSRFGRS